MSMFDALNHAFAAISTGGFSTRVESIGHWDSVAIEAITLALMVLGSLNFATAWLLLLRNGRAVARNGEVRVMAAAIPLAAALLFVLTCRALYPALGKAARVAIFEAVSALTTTGFSTVGYGDWNGFGVLVLIMLMLIGGGACSTAGAIKQYRVYLLVKSLASELRRMVLPARAVTQVRVWEGDQEVFVDDARLGRVGTFVALYVATWLTGAAVLCAHGYGMRDALFEYASSIGTVGLSVGVTSPTAPAAVMWVQIVGMFLGRLEFFVIFAAIVGVIRNVAAFTPRPRAATRSPEHRSRD
jgi:trk system potassium uptake protein TrkH